MKYCTQLYAERVSNGLFQQFAGEIIEAPSQKLAQEWCDIHKPYLKVTGELIMSADIDFENGITNLVDFDIIKNN